MFKEILHYTFKQPYMALDISGFNHHGDAIAVGHSTDGAESASGACVFNGQNSRVHVPAGNVWQELGAIKIEALVRLDDVVESGMVGRHTIAEGFLSFSLFVRRADGVVGAVVLMPEETDASAPIASGSSNSILTTLLAGGQAPDPSSTITANLPDPDPDEPEVDFAWIGVSSDSEFSPDGVRRTVTPGIWTRIVFVHDGVSLQLWLDDILAGYRDDVTFGVLGVQTGEVLIGAQQGGFGGSNLVLKGELDEVSIYKFDPYFLAKQFFCRPLDTRQAVCWRGLP